MTRASFITEMICHSNAPAPLISLPNDCIELGWPGRENLMRFQNEKIKKRDLPQSAVGSDLFTVLAFCAVRHPIFYLHMCICVLAFVFASKIYAAATHVEIERASCKAHKREISATDVESSWPQGAVFKQVTGRKHQDLRPPRPP